MLPEVDGDSETFERVEPTRDLGPVADRAESFGEMFGDFGTAGATIPRAEPVILALPARPAVRRDTDDVITGSQQATRGPATGHIPMGEPAGARSAPEAEVDLIDIIDTGVVPSLDLDAALMAPEAATTEVGGPDPRPADSTVVAPTPRAAASDWTEDETTGASIPQGADPLTTETVEPADAGAADAWLDKQIAAQTSAFTVEGGTPRLALVADEALARGLQGHLDVRVLMHRTARYPVIMLVLGPPAAFRIPTPAQLAVLSLDIGNDRDRAVLAALGRRFELVVDVIVGARRVRRVRLLAPLAENVGYILRAAEDHLRGVAVEGEPSLARARELVTSAGFDLLGTNHLEAVEFRDDKLAQLATAQQARRAIAMARRFARPSREDYLVCTRGFPLTRWRELRRHVLETAVAWGLWMGPELAQVAVSEGLARSRRDLVVKLDRGTEALRRNRDANDVDDDATNDNATALAEEAKALGVELKAGATGTNGATGATGQSELRVPSPPGGAGPSGATTSEDGAQVSGSIGGTPATGMPTVKPLPARPAMAAPPALRKHTVDQLLALLEDRDQRVAAAVELCERGDARAAGPVVATVGKLSRAEAVKVLGMAVKFGDAAKGPLLEGLKSSKAFLRHGSALALGLLRTEDGTQAVIDLLLTEPTEIWREVARAIGQVGPTALLTLASTYGRLGDKATPALAERVAWAMAHVAVRGGRAAIETMAGGHSVVAPVAKHALELHASAANDHVRVRPGHEASAAGRDMTVNRAFSRKFFEALEEGLPETGAAALEALDASSPMELLDESDLIDDDEDAEEAFGDGSEVLADGSEVIDDLDDEIDEANLISR